MFVGRKNELAKLEEAYRTKEFQMAVIYGRRRVGKTTLIGEFAKGKRTLFFTALEQANADNLADFSQAIASFFDLPSDTRFGSWRAAIDFISSRAAQERFVFVFDEFPYAVKREPSLPSVLQVAIDHSLKDTQCYIVLCGSSQGAMESDVLGSKSPLYGRRTLQMKLGPLGYLEAAEMLPWMGPDEAFRSYACVGGVPYYLAQLKKGTSLRKNLAQLYFDTMGFLYREPELLLRQELSEPAAYNSVLRAIASGANRPKARADRTGIERSSLPGYLSTLTNLGIVERVVPFGENPDRSKHAIYRIREALFDFWFRFVMPYVPTIEAGLGQAAANAITEEDFSTYLGHHFERVCEEWIAIQALSGSLPVAVVATGSWWGTDPVEREQVDIDVIGADAKGKHIIACECKYRNTFDETETLRTLEQRASLVEDCTADALFLFTKKPVSKGTRTKVDADSRLHTYCLKELYTQ